MNSGDLDQPVDTEVLLSHLRSSHANVQDVIKFIDAKTGALTGLTTLILAVPFLMLRFFVGETYKADLWCNPFPFFPQFPAYSLSALLISFLSGLISICCSINSLVARPPSRWLNKGAPDPSRFCILFPYYSQKETDGAKKYFSKIVSGLTGKELLTEYQHQTEQLGSIVQRKIMWHRRAVFFFLGQLILPMGIILPFKALNYLSLKVSSWWYKKDVKGKDIQPPKKANRNNQKKR